MNLWVVWLILSARNDDPPPNPLRKGGGLNGVTAVRKQRGLNARSAFLGEGKSCSKNKVENEAKRFDPKEKIRESGLSFFRGQPR